MCKFLSRKSAEIVYLTRPNPLACGVIYREMKGSQNRYP